MSKISGINLIN